MTNRTQRLIAGAFVAAAVAAPPGAAVLTTGSPEMSAQCLAWVGNKEDGKCVSYSNGNGINVGTPDIGIYGPNAGSLPGGGIGVSTGPLLPSRSWTNGAGIN